MRLIEDLVLLGPNRRSERTLVEFWLEAEPGDAEILARAADHLARETARSFTAAGVAVSEERLLEAARCADPLEGFARVVTELALSLQRAAGHRVGLADFGRAARPGCYWFAVGHEHPEVGLEACALALRAARDAVDGLSLELLGEADDEDPPPEERIAAFLAAAAERVLPRETQAIIDAAARLDVPCVKLDRAPYAGISGPFRLRPNGLLKLGHGCRQRVLDGTFAIDSPDHAAALLFDRAAVCQALDVLALPRPAHDPGVPVAETARAALRSAERLGYPVLLRPRKAWRTPPPPPPAHCRHAGELLAAAETALRAGEGAVLEAFVEGPAWVILVVNGEVLCALRQDNGESVADVTAELHPGTGERAAEAARRLGVGMLALRVVGRDLSRPLEEAGVAMDLDVAPALDRLLPQDAPFPAQDLMARAAEGLVRFLFPPGTPARIPLVVVTGTNGKTTTSTLIARMFGQAGLFAGRASTTGVFLDEQRVEEGDQAGGSGHHRVLESAGVQAAVLETARGGVTEEGLMFDACDVSVFTNVSPDHLGLRGVETVEDMAALKEMIVHRARRAIVLNADNAFSLGMLPRVAPREAWLVSAREDAAALRARHGEGVHLCTVEQVDGREWIVADRAGRRQPLLPVDEVPITFGGELRFNVSNALQAAAAGLALDLPLEAIRAALTDFEPEFGSSPGRLNFYEKLPFTVLFDYVHNADGHRQLADFLQRREVHGRRILHFSASASWSDEAIRDLGRSVAGSYDLYLCRGYPMHFRRQPGEVSRLLAEGLLDAGVDPDRVMVLEGETPDTLAQGLALCRPGDLLVFACSTRLMRQEWETITSWSATG